MNDFQLLAAWVGLIGGATGFMALLLQAWNNYFSNPRIKILLTDALDPNKGKSLLSLEVINTGGKSISLNNVGIQYSNKMHSPVNLFPVQDHIGPILPTRLDSHSSLNWYLGRESIINSINDNKFGSKVVAYVNLSTGKRIFSKSYSVIDI